MAATSSDETASQTGYVTTTLIGFRRIGRYSQDKKEAIGAAETMNRGPMAYLSLPVSVSLRKQFATMFAVLSKG